MVWSLVEALSIPGDRRAFFLPLASIPPGNTTVRAVEQSQFEPADNTTIPDDPFFSIRITPPTGGSFTDEGTLPDPAIRLHAMAPGIVRFKPSDATMGDRLILEMPMFLGNVAVPWWQRWVEANCLPFQIIYELVDKVELETLLNGMQPGQSFFGLNFPPEVLTSIDQATFIAGFLAGNDGFVMSAEAGAVIGTVAPSAPDRILRLHARYHDHTDANPHPMNPREFLHLLFGNDSDEYIHHPLLLKIDIVGIGQTGLESKTMRLRPPLRTSQRVVWEANQEIDNHSADWQPSGSLGSGRFYNTHSRDGRTFSNGNYTGANKCNLFISDICLRAGFRINLHPVDTNAWHYIDANSHCNLAHRAAGNTDRVALQGRAEDATLTWGWKIENWMRAQAIASLQQDLNNALSQEGRCFILAGARARRFIRTNCSGTQGFCDCAASLRRNGIGHIVIVKEVLAQPTLAATVGEGLQRIRVRTMEASGSGATSRDAIFQVGGAGAAAAAPTGFIRLHLFELHPGGDPDTVQGLRNLNVHSANTNLLHTANESAAQQQLTHMPDGTPRTDHVCCHDQWPTNDSATQGPC